MRCAKLCSSVMLALGASCSDENPVEVPVEVSTETGEIRVSVVTAGTDLDVDGYTILVDSVPAATISVNDSRVLSGLPFGRHTIELLGPAPNCAADQALHEITLTREQAAVVAFAVSCDPWPARSSLHGQIAFVRTRDGSPYIYVARAGSLTRLTPGESPAWSPDGGKIAFQRSTGDGSWEIAIIDADGSDLRVLHRNGENPAWSPDGSKIVFNTPCCTPTGVPFVEGGIFVMNADGSGVVRLISSDYFAQGEYLVSPIWSPDGHDIAFVRIDCCWDDISRLYVMNADGSDPRHLFIPAGVEGWESGVGRHASWSPDGARLLLQAYRIVTWDSDWVIGSVALNGSDFRTYASSAWYVGNPDWSPDGRSIVFDMFTAPPEESSPLRIFVVDTAGGEARQLIPDAVRLVPRDYRDDQPAWSR